MKFVNVGLILCVSLITFAIMRPSPIAQTAARKKKLGAEISNCETMVWTEVERTEDAGAIMVQ
jgi:hypothetical protein